MDEGTPIKSHIAEFTSIINELDKIEVKIENEDQVFLLLCYLPSLYKSSRKPIICGGKLTIKVNKIKEHLLNKDKIDKQMTRESHRDDSVQVVFKKEKIMKIPRITENIRIWCTTGVTRKGILELIVGLTKK